MEHTPHQYQYDHTKKLLNVLKISHNLSRGMRQKINEQAQTFLKSLQPEATKFFRQGLDSEIHSGEDTRTLLSAVPGILSACDANGNLPIHHMSFWESRSGDLIPVLVEEGMKKDKDGDGDGDATVQVAATVGRDVNVKRGGLLFKNKIGVNALQCLCRSFGDHTHKPNRLHVLRKLRQMRSFSNDDIRQCDLLRECLDHDAWDIIHFLIDCDVDLLRIWRSKAGYSLLQHSIMLSKNQRSMAIMTENCESLFRKALETFPREVGLLFEPDHLTRSAFHMACAAFGKENFVNYFERSIAEGDLVKKQIFEIDAKTGMYPFIIVAANGEAVGGGSGSGEDLNVIYHLLRHCPSVVEDAIHDMEQISPNEGPPSKRRKKKSYQTNHGLFDPDINYRSPIQSSCRKVLEMTEIIMETYFPWALYFWNFLTSRALKNINRK